MVFSSSITPDSISLSFSAPISSFFELPVLGLMSDRAPAESAFAFAMSSSAAGAATTLASAARVLLSASAGVGSRFTAGLISPRAVTGSAAVAFTGAAEPLDALAFAPESVCVVAGLV